MKERLEEERISLKMIEAAALIVLILFILFILLWIDFRWGKNKTHKTQNKLYFPFVGVILLYSPPGPELFQDLFAEIEQAAKYVHILFYIIQNDQSSQ